MVSAASIEVPEWLRRHYELVDAGRLDDYRADFANDVELRFGHAPAIDGIDAVAERLAAGHARHAIAHTFEHVWQAGDTTIVEFSVTYTYPDGRAETTPVMTVLERRNDLITSLRIYIDRLREPA
jgi:ketosteroid isomerase-like protein